MRKTENMERVSVLDAAREIGCHPQYLRQQMANREWDLGVVQKHGYHRTYFVFRNKLDKFLGKEATS